MEVCGTNDQTIKADAGKPRLTLVPQQIIYDIAKVREYGLAKQGYGLRTENPPALTVGRSQIILLIRRQV